MELSSNECQKKIEEFQTIKDKLTPIISDFDLYISDSHNISVYLEDLVIDNEPLDKQVLSDMSAALTSSKDIVQSIIYECNVRISYYEVLYLRAKARENVANASPEEDGSI